MSETIKSLSGALRILLFPPAAADETSAQAPSGVKRTHDDENSGKTSRRVRGNGFDNKNDKAKDDDKNEKDHDENDKDARVARETFEREVHLRDARDGKKT